MDKPSIQLGFAEPPEEDSIPLFQNPNWSDWDGGLVGGAPVWLVPHNRNGEEIKDSLNLTCDACSEPLAFLLQIYAPVDEIEEAFHRCLYVFVCRTKGCLQSGCGNAARVIRCQLPRVNKYYSVEGDGDSEGTDSTSCDSASCFSKFSRFDLVVEEEPEDESIDKAVEDESKMPSTVQLVKKGKCGVCDEHAPYACGSCKSVSYCGKEHQREDWASHKRFCKLMAQASLESDSAEIENEGDEDITQEMIDKIVHGDSEQLKRMLDNKDPLFLEFQERIQREPEQCLRYCRWEENNFAKGGDAGPILWFSQASKPTFENGKPTPCERCGAARQFEFQILPQLINHLDQDECPDFGTIVVYTCTKSCGQLEPAEAAENYYSNEFVWVNNGPSSIDLEKRA